MRDRRVGELVHLFLFCVQHVEGQMDAFVGFEEIGLFETKDAVQWESEVLDIKRDVVDFDVAYEERAFIMEVEPGFFAYARDEFERELGGEAFLYFSGNGFLEAFDLFYDFYGIFKGILYNSTIIRLFSLCC